MDAHSNRVQSGHRTIIYQSVRPMSPIYINIYRDTIHRTDGQTHIISVGQVEPIMRQGNISLSNIFSNRLHQRKKRTKKKKLVTLEAGTCGRLVLQWWPSAKAAEYKQYKTNRWHIQDNTLRS